MLNVTFRQLQVFASVARAESFSRAAQQLHLTQPAVSMQIHQLEEATGIALLERLGRKTVLTEAGTELLARAAAIEEQLRLAQESLDALRGARIGTLKLGAVSTAKYFAPFLLADFTAQHAGVTVQFSVGNRTEIVRMLADHEIDLAIMGRPPRELQTIAQAMARHPFVLIAPPNHPLAGSHRIPLRRLADQRFLVREQGSGTRASMERLFQERGVTFQASMEASSNETIKQAVIAGMGISFISMHTVGLELRAGKLVQLDVVGMPLMRDWYVIQLKEKRLAPIPQAFREFLMARGAAIIQQATGIGL